MGRALLFVVALIVISIGALSAATFQELSFKYAALYHFAHGADAEDPFPEEDDRENLLWIINIEFKTVEAGPHLPGSDAERQTHYLQELFIALVQKWVIPAEAVEAIQNNQLASYRARKIFSTPSYP